MKQIKDLIDLITLEKVGENIFQGKNSIKKNYGLKIVDAKMIGDDVKIIYTRNAY